MKNNALFYILFSMISMLLFTACEKAEIKSEAKIHSRIDCPIDDCQDCPDDDCCCSVELLTTGPVTLDFCGTSGPCLSTTSCSALGLPNCPDISGFKETITLANQFATALFCVPQNAPFGINLASPTNVQHQVRLTCQVGQSSPQFVTITLNTPPDKPYWSTGTDCSLTSCF